VSSREPGGRWGAGELNRVRVLSGCCPDFDAEFRREKRKESEHVARGRRCWFFVGDAMLVVVMQELHDSRSSHVNLGFDLRFDWSFEQRRCTREL
jgi:hypothetical protein